MGFIKHGAVSIRQCRAMSTGRFSTPDRSPPPTAARCLAFVPDPGARHSRGARNGLRRERLARIRVDSRYGRHPRAVAYFVGRFAPALALHRIAFPRSVPRTCPLVQPVGPIKLLGRKAPAAMLALYSSLQRRRGPAANLSARLTFGGRQVPLGHACRLSPLSQYIDSWRLHVGSILPRKETPP